MTQKQVDYWDQANSFQLRMEDECSEAVREGKLGEFERKLEDLELRLSNEPWFRDARPVAQEVTLKCLRRDIRRMIRNYRLDEAALAACFG